jgi:hypothetical protein
VSCPQPRFCPGEKTPVPIVQEAGWGPELVWTKTLQKKFFRLCRGSNLELPSVRGYSWATLSPGDINMEAWSSSLGVRLTTSPFKNKFVENFRRKKIPRRGQSTFIGLWCHWWWWWRSNSVFVCYIIYNIYSTQKLNSTFMYIIYNTIYIGYTLELFIDWWNVMCQN